MKPKSNRNRHTGKINAFKRDILKNGRRVTVGDTRYKVSANGTFVKL